MEDKEDTEQMEILKQQS